MIIKDENISEDSCLKLSTILANIEGSNLECKLKNILQEKSQLWDVVQELRKELEEEKAKNEQFEKLSLLPSIDGFKLIEMKSKLTLNTKMILCG